MKLLVDSPKQYYNLPDDIGEVFQVNSESVYMFIDEDDSASEIRAEWLYKTCVENGIHMAMVADDGVAQVLKGFGINVIQMV